jgi:hypothetical protein
LVNVGSVRQKHIGKGALVLIEAVRLERDFFSKDEGRDGVLGVVAKCLAFFRAIDPAQTDALRACVVQNFDGVAVEDGDDGAGEVGKSRRTG